MASQLLDIARPISVANSSSSSLYTSSLASSPGLYIPIHKRRSGSPSSIASSSSGASSSEYIAPQPLIYSREDLLILASSPLSRKPLEHGLVESFPSILRSRGDEIQRALHMSGTRQYNHNRSGRRGRRYRRTPKGIDDSDQSSTRSLSSERSS